MFLRILAILIITIFLTGCGKQSTFVNVNLPITDNTDNTNAVLGNNNIDSDTNINNNSNTVNNNVNNSNSNVTTTTPVKVEIPSRLELNVDFAPQAPYGNWDELHEEACEEASMITAAKYFLKQPLNEKIMDEELLKLDSWEKDRGYKIDLSAQETAKVLSEYFKLKAKVTNDVSVDRIKYELSLGNLVIVPAAGRELENPYFRAPGPMYHMLVIKGYTGSEFITNEVGTKRGDGFKYKYQHLIEAIHDWNPTWSHYEVTDDQMTSQPKRMVIVNI
jgi:hypothetical protein